MVAQTAEFKKAVEDSRKLKAKPSDDELLQVREQWFRVKGKAHETNCSGIALRTVQAGHPGPSYRVLRQARHVRPQGTPTPSTHNRDPPFQGEQDADTSLPQQGKAKRNAWQKLVDEGVTPQDAQKKYVALVESLKKKHGYSG